MQNNAKQLETMEENLRIGCGVTSMSISAVLDGVHIRADVRMQ